MHIFTDQDIKFVVAVLADLMETIVVDPAVHRGNEVWMEHLETIKRLRIIADYKLNKPFGVTGKYEWDAIPLEKDKK